MVGRALHGKTISENGEKLPKDEIIVSDLVNSEPEIASRHITVRGLKKLVNLTRGTDSEIIKLVQNEYISEILLYYDLEEIFSIEGLESIYNEFALKYDLEIEEFLEKLETERESLEQENHTIILKLKSNNKFGNTYADREKEFEFDLKTISILLKMYKKEGLEKEILKKESNKGKAKIYFETISEEDFRNDLNNITNFVTQNKTNKINGLNFRQIYDGYLNYRLGIKEGKERFKYSGTIVKLLKEFKEGKIKDLKTLDELFKKEKIKVDELIEIKKETFEISSEKYFGEKFNEKTFKNDLNNITNFVTTNKTDKIQGLSFKQIYNGYLNYRLGIKEHKERAKYYGTIVKLLKEFKEGKVKYLKTLDELFKKEKIKVDELIEIKKETFEITSEKYFGDSFNEKTFKNDLDNITEFKVHNKTNKIKGLSFLQIYDGYLNYRLGESKERKKYKGTIVKLLKEFKEGKIENLKTLDELFKKEKIKVDELFEIKKETFEISSQEYFGKKFDEKTFKKDLNNITNFVTKNTTDKIKGLSYKQIYDGYLKYRLGIKEHKERFKYFGTIVKLLKDFKEGTVKDLKTLDELFKKEKIKIDELIEIKKETFEITPQEYFGKKFDEKTFKNDLDNITEFKTNNKTDKIKGLSFFQIYDGYLNYTLGIKEFKERAKYFGTIVRLLKEFKEGKIKDLKTLDELFKKEKIKVDELVEIKKETFEITSEKYFGDSFNEETFKNDLDNITNFVTTNKTDKIKGLSFLQIYNGYLNYILNIKEQKEREKYYGTIVKLLKEFKNGGKLPDLETLKKE